MLMKQNVNNDITKDSPIGQVLVPPRTARIYSFIHSFIYFFIYLITDLFIHSFLSFFLSFFLVYLLTYLPTSYLLVCLFI